MANISLVFLTCLILVVVAQPDAFALLKNNRIVGLNVANPSHILSSRTIFGLNSGDIVVGIDRRPANNVVYALGQNPLGGLSTIYTLDFSNTLYVQATAVGPSSTPYFNGLDFGFDFNPVPDRIRVNGETLANYRLNPINGALASKDGDLSHNVNGTNARYTPQIRGSAYINGAGANTTTLYAIDTFLNILVSQVPPNDGVLNTIGSLGVDAKNYVGFDIYPLSGNAAYAALEVSGRTGLYSINLSTGAATLVGHFPSHVHHIRSLALVAPGTAASAPFYASPEESSSSSSSS